MRRRTLWAGTTTLLGIALAGVALSADTAPARLTLDLRKIGHVAPKGRVQDKDYNPNLPVVDALIEAGPAAIPFLIAKLEDGTEIEEPVLDYWSHVRVGDVALLILCDFFTTSDWKRSTISGLRWDAILERSDPDTPAWTVLDDFLRKHGRVGLRRRVETLLKPYGFSWDANERCFKPVK